MGDKKYTSSLSVEDLLWVSIKSLGRSLRKSGYSMDRLFRLLRDGKIESVSGTMSFQTSRGRETRESGRIRYSYNQDSEGVYLELRYSYSVNGGDFIPQVQRYYLVQRESNLKPGSYRYYFLDPYSVKEEGLCSKIYFLPKTGEFVTRTILQDWGILYRQQRKGHTDRYVWSYYHRIPDSFGKYRKRQYRGKITPDYEKYLSRAEEGDRRVRAYLIAKGYGEYWGVTESHEDSEIGNLSNSAYNPPESPQMSQ